MLAKANRITRGSDYKATVRFGKRYVSTNTVTYIRSESGRDGVRFGLIVGKSVGGATRRNAVRRRLKAACYRVAPDVRSGSDIVVRALPASVNARWATLLEEISRAISKGNLTL